MFYANYVRERMKSLPKFEETEGNPIIIEDSLKRPFRKLNLFGESVQDGTPTPDLPIEIVSVKNPVVRVTGNNLFNINIVTNGSGSINNGDGTITINQYPGYTSHKLFELCPAIKAGDRIAILFDTTGTIKQVYFAGCTPSYVGRGTVFTVTEAHLNKRLAFYCNRVNGENVPAVVSNIRVVFEGCPTDYAPYIEPQEVVLDGITLRGVCQGEEEYRDEIVIDRVKQIVKVIERCYEVVIGDGNTLAKYINGRGFMFQDVLKDVGRRKKGLISNGHRLNDAYGLGFWLGDGNKAVYWIYSPFFDDMLEDYGVANVKSYLAENPIKIVTHYETPVETDITDTEVGQKLLGLYTNNGITRISLDSTSGKGEIKAKYVRK